MSQLPLHTHGVPRERWLDIPRVAPLFDPLAAPGRVASEWPRTRSLAKARWRRQLGVGPKVVTPSVTWGDQERFEGIRSRHLVYRTGDGDSVPALVYEPESRLSTPGPAVLGLHQTTGVGKLEPAGLAGLPDLAYGRELALRGYTVLMPDLFVAGERAVNPYPYDCTEFDAVRPNWSAVGKMLFDHRHAVSVLETLPSVDVDRIGAIGHSLGGFNAWVLLGADPRVRVAASSCGYASFAGDPNPYLWSMQPFPYFPRLARWLDRKEVPFEMSEAVALDAPKPLFFYITKQDFENAPHWPACLASLEPVHDLYQRLSGDSSRFVVEVGEGDHSFPPEAREAAYAFLEKWL